MYHLTRKAIVAQLALVGLVVAGCGGQATERRRASTPTAAKVWALQRVVPAGGWILTDAGLEWRGGSGASKRAITPPGEPASDIAAVFFLDTQHGWAATRPGRSENGSEVTIFRTSDQGSTWKLAKLTATPAVADVSSLDFVDERHGFLLAKIESSSNFSVGELYGTQDAGATWTKLPAPNGGSLRFITRTLGFIAGGPQNDHLYRTNHGGGSWQEQSVVLPSGFPGSQPVYGLPSFADNLTGVLPVTLTGSSPAVAFYSTTNGGTSWTLAAVRRVPGALEQGVGVPTDVLAPDAWVVASLGGERIFSTADRGRSWRVIAPNGLPEGVSAIDFATLADGWSLIQSGQCAGFKTDCTTTREARTTGDGGQTWDVLRD